MNRHFAGTFMLFMLSILMVSCVVREKNTLRMQVMNLQDNVTFDAEPVSSETFTVDAKEIWIIRSKDLDWITVDPSSGGSGTYSINLTSDVNEWEYPREGELIIESPSFKKVVKVTQSPAIIIGDVSFAGIEDGMLRIPSVAGDYPFEVLANLEWTAQVADMPWAKISPAEGMRKTPTTVTLTAEANEVTQPRSGRVEFTLKDGSVVSLNVEQDAFDAEISLSESSALASASGSVVPQSITVTANASWTASSDVGWVTVDPAQGEVGETPVTLVLQPNDTKQDREAKVVFDNHGLKAELTVSQYWEVLDISTEEVGINYPGTGSVADGSPCQVSVTASGAWTATASDWITVTPASGDGDAVITLTATRNGTEARSGEVTVSCGRLSRTISVTQEPSTAYFIDLASEGQITWPSSGTKASVTAYSPEWATKGIALPSTHNDLAYAEWVPSAETIAKGFDQLFVIASNGNLVSRNNWTNDALVFHIPVLSIPKGKSIHLYFGTQAVGAQPRFWAAEINIDGTWIMMDTGTLEKTFNLGVDSNIIVNKTSALPFEAVYVVPEDVREQEIQLRIRVADGTTNVGGNTISTVAGSGSSLRFQPNSKHGGLGLSVSVE